MAASGYKSKFNNFNQDNLVTIHKLYVFKKTIIPVHRSLRWVLLRPATAVKFYIVQQQQENLVIFCSLKLRPILAVWIT